jgi:hypothetical protein
LVCANDEGPDSARCSAQGVATYFAHSWLTLAQAAVRAIAGLWLTVWAIRRRGMTLSNPIGEWSREGKE